MCFVLMDYPRRALRILREDGGKALALATWRFAKSRKKRLSQRRDNAFRNLKHRVKWGQAAPSPYRVFSIDPASVEYVLAPRFQEDLSRGGTYIRSGDWDVRVSETPLVYAGKYEDPFDRRMVVPYEDYILHQSFVDHFNHGVPWEDTEFFQWALEKRVSSRFKTIEAIHERFAYFDELYENMKREGYKRQEELGKRPAYDEVLVDIGRDGRIILDDGRHRLSIAKILGFETIPARGFVRHEEWQRLRHEIVTEGEHILQNVTGVDINHPDLRAIV